VPRHQTWISHEISWDWTRDSVVICQCLTAWAVYDMATLHCILLYSVMACICDRSCDVTCIL
jgi:hypothetical protein